MITLSPFIGSTGIWHLSRKGEGKLIGSTENYSPVVRRKINQLSIVTPFSRQTYRQRVIPEKSDTHDQ